MSTHPLLDGKPLPEGKFSLGEGEWTLTALRKLVAAALGKRARIWEDVSEDGGTYYTVGLDARPGRKSLGWGVTPREAVENSFDWRNSEFKRPEPKAASDELTKEAEKADLPY